MRNGMILEEVVVFDLDGTLVDSAGLWCGATRGAIAEVYARRGIAAAPPEEARLRSVIGTPAPDSLFALLPPEHHGLVPEVTEGVRRLGSEAMRGGAPPLFPGALACLEELKRAGCAVAIATNAGHRYLDACLDSLGLRTLVDLAYCLDSPGVCSEKGDMVAAVLRDLGTRRGVMVGDRSQDLAAAHGNGIPFVAFSAGYGAEEEWAGAEARVGGHGELLELLGRRAGAIRAIAETVARRADGRGGRVVGVTGPPGAGKSLFAEDLANVLRSLGLDVSLLRLDDYRRTVPVPRGDHLGAAFELDDFRGALARSRNAAPATVVEGIFLLDPRLRPSLDFAIHLEAPEEILLRRLAATRGPEEARRAREVFLPAHAAFAVAHPRRRLADLRLDASNPLRLEFVD